MKIQKNELEELKTNILCCNNEIQQQYLEIKLPFLFQNTTNIQKIINLKELEEFINQTKNKIIQFQNIQDNLPLILSKKKQIGYLINQNQFIGMITIFYDFDHFQDFIFESGFDHQIEQFFLLGYDEDFIENKLHSFIQSNFKEIVHSCQPFPFLKQYNSKLNNLISLNQIAFQKSNECQSKSINYNQNQIYYDSNQVKSYLCINYVIDSLRNKLGDSNKILIRVSFQNFLSNIYQQQNVKIQELFEKRKIWIKNTLLTAISENYQEVFSQQIFKQIIVHFAYTFRNGPFKFAYIKLGYDPRKLENAEYSIQYQIIDISFQQKIGILLNEKENIQNQDKKYFAGFELYDYTFQRKPSKYRHSYQIKDIEEENIQEILNQAIQRIHQSQQSICHKKFGWFTKQEFKKIIKFLKDKIRFWNQIY